MALNPISGNNLNNNLHGTVLADRITGLGGNDALFGLSGRDRLFGGSGEDYMFGDGDDDIINGGSGMDFISGGDGNDLSYGGEGHDTIIAFSGNDTMYGDAGNDKLEFGFSGTGTSQMYGGDGDDTLRLGAGQNGLADGGAGADTVIIDLTSINTTNAPVVIALSGPLAGAAGSGVAVAFSGIERLFAFTTNGDDTVTGGTLDDVIWVRHGANTVLALGGDDWISYLVSDSNIIDAGAGNDRITLGATGQSAVHLVVSGTSATDGFGSTLLNAENFQVDGGSLNDVALFGAGNDLFDGSRGDDRADGNDGSDALRGGKGNDLLSGGTGDDRIKGGDDDDVLDGGDGDDTLEGGDGTDVLTGGLGADDFRLTRTDTSQTFIADFTGGTDRLLIGIGKTGVVTDISGPLDPALFNLDAAVGSFAQFVFIDDFGPLSRLVYDVNGADAGGEQTFCQFTGPVFLTAADIFMV